jgi:anti-sigma factor RsiW
MTGSLPKGGCAVKDHCRPEDLSAWLDNELRSEERRSIDQHVEHCGSCSRQLDILRETKDRSKSAPRRSLPPSLRRRLAQLPETAAPRRFPIFIPSWLTAGAAAVFLVIGGWVGYERWSSETEIPLEPLLAAHSRYSEESLSAQHELAASNFSIQLAHYEGSAP